MNESEDNGAEEMDKPKKNKDFEYRISQLVRERNEANQKYELELSKNAGLQSKIDEGIGYLDQNAQLNQQLLEMRNTVDMERHFMQSGITDAEGLKFAKMAFEMIEGEKPDLSEWLNSDSVPRAVKAYMPQPVSAAPLTASVSPTPQAVEVPAVSAPAAKPVNANQGAETAPHYNGTPDFKAAAQDPEYFRNNRAEFLTPDGFAKAVIDISDRQT